MNNISGPKRILLKKKKYKIKPKDSGRPGGGENFSREKGALKRILTTVAGSRVMGNGWWFVLGEKEGGVGNGGEDGIAIKQQVKLLEAGYGLEKACLR